MSPLDTLKALVAKQSEDVALRILDPTATEAYILQALRDLHAAVEGEPSSAENVWWCPKCESRVRGTSCQHYLDRSKPPRCPDCGVLIPGNHAIACSIEVEQRNLGKEPSA